MAKSRIQNRLAILIPITLTSGKSIALQPNGWSDEVDDAELGDDVRMIERRGAITIVAVEVKASKKSAAGESVPEKSESN